MKKVVISQKNMILHLSKYIIGDRFTLFLNGVLLRKLKLSYCLTVATCRLIVLECYTTIECLLLNRFLSGFS